MYLAKKRPDSWHIWFSFVLCCLFLSSCNEAAATNQLSSDQQKTVASQSAPAKSDVLGIPSEARRRAELAKVQKIMADMTPDQKIGQLILVEYIGTDYYDQLQDMITKYFVNGYIYQGGGQTNNNFAPPYNQADKMAEFSKRAMSDARIPLLITTDQEGGQVNRLSSYHGNQPSAAELTTGGNTEAVQAQAAQYAAWLKDIGVNSDLAPVVDVSTNKTPLLENRIFSSNPQTVATYASSFLKGLQDHNIPGCLKHFPGIGSLQPNQDPHNTAFPIKRTLAELESTEFVPYKNIIQNNPPAMIMPTDVYVPAIDPDIIAELSPKVIDGVLRKELGYDGVVITDGIYMGGVTHDWDGAYHNWTVPKAAVQAIVAGDDIVEGPYTVDMLAQIVQEFHSALLTGKLTQARIDLSVKRILQMKVHYGIIP